MSLRGFTSLDSSSNKNVENADSKNNNVFQSWCIKYTSGHDYN